MCEKVWGSAMSDVKRRDALQLLALAPAMAALGVVLPAGAQDRSAQSSSLVAYFSRTGNTRVIARQIERATSADIFEITPVVPYPDDYEQTVSQARRETEEGFRPDLRASVNNIDRYDTVYLGSPIWGMTAPPVIRAFLAAHDLRGVRPCRQRAPLSAVRARSHSHQMQTSGARVTSVVEGIRTSPQKPAQRFGFFGARASPHSAAIMPACAADSRPNKGPRGQTVNNKTGAYAGGAQFLRLLASAFAVYQRDGGAALPKDDPHLRTPPMLCLGQRCRWWRPWWMSRL